MEQLQLFFSSLNDLWRQVQEQAPKVMAAFVLLLFGWIFARLVEKGAARIFHLIKLEELAERSGIENFLYRGGVRFTVSRLIAKLLYWFIMMILTLSILNSLGLRAASELVNQMVLYIPNAIIAFVVLLFGTLFANFIQSASNAYLSNIGLKGSEALSLVVKYTILIFVISMALEHLNIGGQILVSAFQIAFGAFCFGFALAFGLGAKDWVAKNLEKLLNEKKERS